MGMSSHVVGYRPADERWSQMKAIWDHCKQAGIAPPVEVRSFFDDEDPTGKPGMEVELRGAVERYSDDSHEGFTVNLRKLPSDVDYLRFYNSY